MWNERGDVFRRTAVGQEGSMLESEEKRSGGCNLVGGEAHVCRGFPLETRH